MTDHGIATEVTPVFRPSAARFMRAPREQGMEAELERRFSREILPHRDVVFEFTRDPALLKQYYMLREQAYTNTWGLSHFSGEEDDYDRHGLILVARKGKQVVAGARAIVRTPRSTKPLPMEDDGIDLQKRLPELQLDRTTYCELSRLARLPEYRGVDFSIQMNRAFKRKAIAHGIRYAFVLAPWSQTRNYRRLTTVDHEHYVICDKIPIPDHDHYEGIRMALSYLEYPNYFEGPDEYGVMHDATEAVASSRREKVE